MKTTTTALAALLLAGCAATTTQEARNMGPERSYVFQVDADYQTTYRRILEAERNCYQGQVLTATMLVNGDLYPDTKSGTISVGMYGGIGASIYQVIDVRGLDDAHSEVTAIIPMGSVQGMGEWIKARATAATPNADLHC